MIKAFRPLVAALVAGLVVLLGAGTAAAHDQLVGSDPPNGASVAIAPAQVTLRFSAAVNGQFSTMTVIGPDGAAYQAGAATTSGPAVSVGLKPLGPAGRYTVGFRIVSSDGHPVQGSTAFTLTAPGPATQPSPAAAVPTTTPSAEPSSAAAAPSTDSGSSTPVWPWVLGGVVLVAGGAAVALRQARR